MSHRPGSVTLVCLAGLLCAASGCAPIGPLVGIIAPPKVHALYKPKKRPMAVLVENALKGGSQASADRLAALLTQELQEHDVAPMVDVARILELRSRDPAAFRNMPMTRIAREVGAAQLLYVRITQAAGGVVDPADTDATLEARVRIVDAKTGQTLWPPHESHLIAYQVSNPEMVRASPELREQLIAGLAASIAGLFYTRVADQ